MIARVAIIFIACLAAAPAMALEARIAIEIDKPAQPLVVGSTNLPDGAELMITIRRKDRRMVAQDKATVMHGRFQAGRFTARGADLAAGVYSAEVYMPAGQNDPRVKNAIGENGEKLTGPLIRDDGYGKAVQRSERFKVN